MIFFIYLYQIIKNGYNWEEINRWVFIILRRYFKVEDIDNAGQFFKRVSRIKAKSKSGEVDMELDVNVDIYPMEKGGEYRVSIVRSLGDY